MKIKKISVITLLCIFLITQFNFSNTSAATNTSTSTNEQSSKNTDIKMYGTSRDGTYSKYIDEYKDAKSPVQAIIIKGADYINKQGKDINKISEFQSTRDVLEWNTKAAEDSYCEWSFNVSEEGLYNINMKYFSLMGNNDEIELALLIDDKAPFIEMESFNLTKVWKDETEIKKDSRDNEIRPRQVEAQMWIENSLKDIEGIYNEPYKFYLTKGEHKITLKGIRTGFALQYIKIFNDKPLLKYDEYIKANNSLTQNAKDIDIVMQGENAILKSDNSLYPMYDRSNSKTYPSDPTKIRLNTIGQLNWEYQGQWLKWSFDVPEDGYYKIGIRARQNYKTGFFSTRRVYIDDKVPFEELNAVEFPFDNKWYMKILGNDEPLLIYLTKGHHNIKLEVIPGQMSQTEKAIQDDVFKLNYWYRKIIMITGTKPDTFRDYYLDREVPGMMDGIKEVLEDLKIQKKFIENMLGSKGSNADSINKLIIQLESFLEEPNTIPARLATFESNISGMSAWMLGLKEQPLEIDYIEIVSAEKTIKEPKANIIESISFGIKKFIGSFTEDYTSIGNTYDDKKAIKVWVSMGRDQVQIIKQMIDDYFTPQTGIEVNINLVKEGLMQAVLAGRGPDVALFVDNDSPVNFAARGAVIDVSQFSDFKEISKRFQSQALNPYYYENKCYALPITNSFQMMFYRKDIFEELNIKVPKTWEDFYKIIPIIQQNNMQIGIPNMNTENAGVSGNSAAGSYDNTIFTTLLYQHGGQFFNQNQSKTGFDSNAAYEAFKQWTDFYTRYTFPLQYNFYNRFRTGEMPIGIESYTMYNKFQVGAPEIKGMWDMVHVPGTIRADGTIDYSVSGGGNSGVIFSNTKDKDASWEFLKWFTRDDMQASFGKSIEALMGPAARYDTANINALEKLPWSSSQYQKLMEQWQYIKEPNQTPASYEITRNIAYAFRRVTYNYENPRETLYKYNEEMNNELERKRLELGTK